MKRLLAVVILVALWAVALPAWAGVIRVRSDSPGPVFDGTSWNTAFHKVQDGVNAAAAGDEVWVAAGTYVERIALKAEVSLYGGFTGINETLRSQRNRRANVTVLDANRMGNVITVAVGATNSTIIDGFTITKSAQCGGIAVSCDRCSPTISNNIMIDNGTAVYASSGSPVILCNEIRSSLQNAIYCSCSQATIANNNIAANGGGIQLSGTGGKIVNNTVVGNIFANGNSGTGINVSGSQNVIANNIIAFNYIGIYGSTTAAQVRNNCVFGNTSKDYSLMTDQTGINGNIKVDPKLASGVFDMHIQPTSPCRNTGNNSDVSAGWTDMDGQQRILPSGGNVDMGADESDGTTYNYVSKPVFSTPSGVYITPQTVKVTCSTSGAVIHYTTNGADPTPTDPVIASGSSIYVDTTITLKANAWKTGWLTAEPTTADYTITGTVATPMISLASGVYPSHKYVTLTCDTPGSTIRYTTNGAEPTTTSHIYESPILVDTSLTLEAKAWKTDWADSTTASATYVMREPSIIRVKFDAPGPTHDGLSWETAITSAKEALDTTVRRDEVWVSKGTYLGCVSLPPGVKLYGGFAGIETDSSQRDPKSNETTLDGNMQGSTVTILYGVNDGTIIDGFTICNGSADSGGGIQVKCGALTTDYAVGTISNNKIMENTANLGGGIACERCGPIISNNEITDNSANSGGGIYSQNASPQVSQNRIARNTAFSGGGITLIDRCSASINNNEIADNLSLGAGGGLYMPKTSWTSGSVNIDRNVFESNTAHSDGGGIALYDTASVACNTILRNTSLSGNGGGLYLTGGMPYSINTNLIAANSAQNGGGIYCSHFNLKTIACTIVDNVATIEGGGIYYDSAGGSLSSTIICGNSSGLFATGPYPRPTFKANCIFHNTSYDFSGFTTNPLDANGNFSADPMFIDQLHTNYLLKPGSPCIDTALECLSEDLNGNLRPRDGDGDGVRLPDIGCYEVPANYMTVPAAKGITDGTPAGITDVIITAKLTDRFYVETPDRVSGIGVLGSALSCGKLCTIEGTLTTVDGERLINPTLIRDNGSVAIPAPLFMNANAIGGARIGLQTGVSDWRSVRKIDDQGEPFYARELTIFGGANNIGLLIKTSGRISYADSDCFYIDSCGVFDDCDENVKGIKVLRLSTISYVPQLGDFVIVTGISSCFAMDGLSDRYARLIWPVSVELVPTAD